MHPALRRTALALTAVAPAFALSIVIAPQSVSASPMCHGREVTHVGGPGVLLKGTTGPDVMLTNGSENVYGREGNDHICVTGRGWPSIDAGEGDDYVDASDHQGPRVSASLKKGDDRYVGSALRDYVHAGGWDAGDDSIFTRGGRDLVLVYDSGDRTEVGLGGGRDRLRIYGQKTRFRIHGGRGRDWVNIRCECRTMMPFLDLDLARGTYAISRGIGTLKGFEDAFVMGADRASITGTGWGNRIKVNACRADVRGRAGRDEILHGKIGPWCAHPRMTFLGEGGDDVLRGGPGGDRLYGGSGRDHADGLGRRDLCRAEAKQRCEA